MDYVHNRGQFRTNGRLCNILQFERKQVALFLKQRKIGVCVVFLSYEPKLRSSNWSRVDNISHIEWFNNIEVTLHVVANIRGGFNFAELMDPSKFLPRKIFQNHGFSSYSLSSKWHFQMLLRTFTKTNPHK